MSTTQKYMLYSNIQATHSRSIHSSSLEFNFHFHDHYELYFFLSGRAEMLVEQTLYPLKPGSLLVFNSNEVHRVLPVPGILYERITIHFDPDLIRGLPLRDCDLLSCFRDRGAKAANAILLSGQAFREYLRIADELVKFHQSGGAADEARVLSRLIELLVIANQGFESVSPMSTAFTGFVAKAAAYIDRNIAEELTIESLARRYSVNPFHFSHEFKQQTGSSPYHYILIRRIALAKQLLAEGANCNQACALSGFGDYNNFSRVFKKYVGSSPGSYRRAHC